MLTTVAHHGLAEEQGHIQKPVLREARRRGRAHGALRQQRWVCSPPWRSRRRRRRSGALYGAQPATGNYPSPFTRRRAR